MDFAVEPAEYAFVLADPDWITRGVFLTWEALVSAMPDHGWPARNPSGVGVIKDDWHAERAYVNPAHIDEKAK